MKNEKTYFNVTTKPILAYVSKIVVTKKGRNETVKLRVNILSGSSDDIKYIPGDFFVNGKAAQSLITSLNDRFVEDEDKVLISFAANVKPSHYISGAQGLEGTVVPTFAGSIHFVKSIKENGTFTHRDEAIQNGGAQ